jgi:phage gpG-like protein
VREGHSGAILVRTGDMARSLTGRPMAIEEYHRLYAEFGTDDQKAVWHQRGHLSPTRLPKREILFKTPRMAGDIAEVLADYIFHGRVR